MTLNPATQNLLAQFREHLKTLYGKSLWQAALQRCMDEARFTTRQGPLLRSIWREGITV